MNAKLTPQSDKYLNAIPLANYAIKDYGYMTISPAEVSAGQSGEIRFVYHAGSK